MPVPVYYLMVENTLEGMLRQMQTAISDAGLMMFLSNEVDYYLRNQADRRFQTEGDEAVGGRWDPLRAATEEYRANQGFPAQHPINQRTGELREYVTETPGAAIAIAGGAQLTVPGTPPSNPYLAEKLETAQVGKANPLTEPRPVLGIDLVDMTSIGAALMASMFGGRATVQR